jgi:hypothetical protein
MSPCWVATFLRKLFNAHDFARVGHLGGRGTQISGRGFLVAASAKILGVADELAGLLWGVLPAGGRGGVRNYDAQSRWPIFA